jgi:hypothetical protein
MSAERPQGEPYQRPLFPELEEGPRHDTAGDGRPEAGVPEESQTLAASDPARALTERLVEEVCHPDNLNLPAPPGRVAAKCVVDRAVGEGLVAIGRDPEC